MVSTGDRKIWQGSSRVQTCHTWHLMKGNKLGAALPSNAQVRLLVLLLFALFAAEQAAHQQAL